MFYLEPLNISDKLFGLEKYFRDFIRLYNEKRFPKVLLISGNKGLGKHTLISHFLSYFYNPSSYDLKNLMINDRSKFFDKYINYTFSNVIYINSQSKSSAGVDFPEQKFWGQSNTYQHNAT